MEEKQYCNNRLTVDYRADAPTLERWLRYLSDLLESEDILTLQEYLGYCLIPSTKGQKMLMLIGKGGEDKSRIGVVMNAIFGFNINATSIQKVETNRFARADLEGKLLMVDDDLDINALSKKLYQIHCYGRIADGLGAQERTELLGAALCSFPLLWQWGIDLPP